MCPACVQGLKGWAAFEGCLCGWCGNGAFVGSISKLQVQGASRGDGARKIQERAETQTPTRVLCNISAAGAVDREFVYFFAFSCVSWAEQGPTEGRDSFKKCLEAVGFVLAEFRPKRSHGEPTRGPNYNFGMFEVVLFFRKRISLFWKRMTLFF